MARPSKIDRLPPEVREEIGQLRANGRTIDEILAKLRELNVEVSRSGLGRHIQELDLLQQDLQQTRATSEALIAKLGDAPESRTARLNIEMLQSAIMRVYAAKRAAGDDLAIKEMNFLADTLYRLGRATKDDADVQIKAEARAKAKMAEQLKELEAKETKAGRALDPDTLRRVREIYGIA